MDSIIFMDKFRLNLRDIAFLKLKIYIIIALHF